MFGKYLVRTGQIDAQWSKYLAWSFDNRLMADYDAGISFTAEKARLECRRAQEFVERIQQYLLAKGLTGQELEPERGNC